MLSMTTLDSVYFLKAGHRPWPVRTLLTALPLMALVPWAGAWAADDEASLTLPDLLVSASRTPVEADKVGSAVTVINRQQLDQRQVRVLSDVLRDVPGVTVNRTGGPGSQTEVYLRGAKSNETLVLIDGIEVNNPVGGSAFDFGDLLNTEVERIEVLRGPQSALWGSDAIGGVINIITKKGSGAPKVTGLVEGGSFGTYHLQSNVSGGGERYHFSLTGDQFHTGGVSSAAEWRGNSEKDGYENTSVVVKGGFSPTEQLDLDFAGRFVNASLKYDDFGYSPTYGVQQAQDADIVEYRKQYFGRLSAEHKSLGERWRNRFDVSVAAYNASDDTNGFQDTIQDGLKYKYSYQSSYNFDTSSGVPAKHTLTGLVEREHEEAYFKSAWSRLAPRTDTTGLVGEYRLDLFDQVFLSGSVRHDANENFKNATTFRVTAAYLHPETATRLRTSVGTGVKNPTLFQLYGYTSTFQGNQGLRPESSFGWDLGVDQPLFDKKLTLGATFFHNDIDNLIVGSGTTAVNVSGLSRVNGLELSASAEPLDHLTVTTAYTFQRTKDADGKELIRRPEHSASVNLAYRFLDDRASLFTTVRYNGSRPDTQYDQFYTQSRTELASYTQVTLGGSYQLIPERGVELFGRIENLLDQKVEQVFSYGSPGVAGFGGLRFKL